MKAIITHFLAVAVSLIFIGCSNDDEILDLKTDKATSEDIEIPVETISDIDSLTIPGLPKSIKKYQDDRLHYWAQYYYRPDGNLIKVKYTYPESSSEIFTDTYEYSIEGNLIELVGHDVYVFHWDKERIVAADKYNGMWYGRSKVFYEYNPKGQLILKKEIYLDFDFSEETTYSYFDDNNLKSIEQFFDNSNSGSLELEFVTHFNAYNDKENLFLELEIIPGQIVQQQFPVSMSFRNQTDPGNDVYEAYDYEFDTEGRVIAKIYDNNKVVYQYY